jgi:hypothetical protein
LTASERENACSLAEKGQVACEDVGADVEQFCDAILPMRCL